MLRREQAKVQAELAATGRHQVLAGVADAPDPAQVWGRLDLDRRRAVIDVLVQVAVLPARKGRRAGWRPGESYFDPASVRITPRTG